MDDEGKKKGCIVVPVPPGEGELLLEKKLRDKGSIGNCSEKSQYTIFGWNRFFFAMGKIYA